MNIVNKKVLSAIIVAFFALSILTSVVPVNAKAQKIDVYAGQSIQAAVNAASAGGKVVVHAGTYNEKVIVEKQLTLLGEEAVLDLTGITFPIAPNSWGNAGIFVAAGGVTVSGFTIKNVPYYPAPVDPSGLPFAFGIRFYGSFAGGLIENNKVESDYDGIGVTGAFQTSGISEVVLRNNKVSASNAVFGFNAPDLTIKNNYITSTTNPDYPDYEPSGISIGSYLIPSVFSDVTINSNEITSEAIGIRVIPQSGGKISEVKIKNNEITAYDAIILTAGTNDAMITGNKINSNRDGIFLENAVNVEIKDNIVFAAMGAIPIVEGSSITVKNNILHAGYCGIGCGANTPIIASASGGTFAGNKIYSDYVGIGIDYLNDVTIKDNTVYSLFHGIFVSAGPNIAIKSNDLHTKGEWGDGISLGLTFGIVSDSLVEGNEIYAGAQQDGITLNHVESVNVRKNTVYSSTQGIVVATGPEITISDNVLHSSFAGINILSGVSDVLVKKNEIYSDNVGVIATAALSITVKDNEIYSSGDAISLTNMGMTNPIVAGNVVYSGHYGIYLTLISEATVKDNEIHIDVNSKPIKGGIVIFGSTGSEVVSNIISGDINSGISLLNSGQVISTANIIAENTIAGVYKLNDAGIRLFAGTTGNIVKHNTITGVNQQILDLGTNIILP